MSFYSQVVAVPFYLALFLLRLYQRLVLPICRQRLSLVAYEVLKNQVLSSLSYSATLTRDAAIFTIAGVTLDAYILALPLDAKVYDDEVLSGFEHSLYLRG